MHPHRSSDIFRTALLTVTVLVIAAMPAHAGLALGNVERYELDNGMTVLLLEDRNFPVVSVQMLYRVGARNEVSGKTGLAHFLEHMAFRATANFPATDVVSRIYARGGEWHGYTWTDQTTYYSTVPKDDAGLLLAIEADRMARLELDAAYVEAERGAVLSELHMYENWPSAMLLDALMVTVFQVHPYRNNTIGWESDIENLGHDDIIAFYRDHYQPANAVLAVVGDFDAADIRARIEDLFGDFERRPATPLPHTREPVQQGERRVAITGTTPGRSFLMGWRAPAATDRDFAAFLVLQELLGGGSGISFLQNDWGTPARPGSVLHGAADAITTWLPPSAQPYVFTVGGSIAGGTTEAAAERAIDERLARFMASAPSQRRSAAAINAVQDELVFDVQTTEDAAHQLAFFAGLDALDVLLTLPARLERVTSDEVLRVARHYLQPERRTIAWYRPGSVVTSTATVIDPVVLPVPAADTVDETPVGAAVLRRLRRGVPAIAQENDLASAVELRVVVRGDALTAPAFTANNPEPGLLSFTGLTRPSGFPGLVKQASQALESARHVGNNAVPTSTDPETRLNEEFRALLALSAPTAGSRALPAVITVAGDIDADTALTTLDDAFGEFSVAGAPASDPAAFPTGRKTVALETPVAQSQLGYIVAAPGPGDEAYLATRILLYILAHDYEGRLGKEAVSRRGLAYYIDARYASAGGPGWITLSIGVDTHKLDALAALLAEELQRLATEPPTAAEIEEARQHFIGRALSAAQSNAELTTKLARHWLWHGELPAVTALRERLNGVTRDDVLAKIPAFIDGMTIAVVP